MTSYDFIITHMTITGLPCNMSTRYRPQRDQDEMVQHISTVGKYSIIFYNCFFTFLLGSFIIRVAPNPVANGLGSNNCR